MKLLITGVGDAFTTRSYGSSALIEAPDGQVLLDCPGPIHRVLHEAGEASQWKIDVDAINHVILTHLHGDHSNGLEMLGFSRRRARGQDASVSLPTVHAAPPVLGRLWEKLAPAMDSPRDGKASNLEDYFLTRMLEPGKEARVAGLAVQCRFTQHPVPTIGLLISDGQSTLGWSGDTSFEPAHIDWLSEADLIVHEGGYGPPHASIELLNALPDALRAKMRLIHLPDDFNPADTDIRPLKQGEVLTV